jgi:predicted permease
LRQLLVVSELALALLLVVGASLFIASFIRVMHIDPGFGVNNVLTLQMNQRAQPGQPPPDLTVPFLEIVERLAQFPGVGAVAAASPGIPLRPNFWISDFQVAGVARGVDKGVSIKTVTAGYHRVLGIPLRRGRLFDATDRLDGAPTVIINEITARRYFGDADPIGRTAMVLRIERTIVGIVGDARQGRLEAAPIAEVYLPLPQNPVSSGYLVIRTSGDPHTIVPAAKTAVLGVLPSMALRKVATMEELISNQTAERRVTMLMLGLFGVLGLVIAAAGVYGAMAYFVVQRTREIGVRMALGATRGRVVAMIITRASLLIVTGIGIGAAGSWYLAGMVKSFLFGLEAHDAGALAAAGVALSVAALVASVVPARRAATVDPTVALRSE